MKAIVELLAFGQPGEIREVHVPDSATSHGPSRIIQREEWLPHVFQYGQNEVQPQPHPSVSAGDVIHIGEDKWLVLLAGFKKLTPEEYESFKQISQPTRRYVADYP